MEQLEMEIEVREEFHVNFEEMVCILFKKHGMHSQYEGLMHAAIGISGEVGEIFEAFLPDTPDQENLLEEYGDLEFYMEALCQAIGVTKDTIGTMSDLLMQKEKGRQYKLTDMVVLAAKILDSAKRCWVYGKELEEMRVKLVTDIAHLTLCVDQIYKACGVKYEDIRYYNQVKLIGEKGRFRNAVYSDAEARNRADKQEGGQ